MRNIGNCQRDLGDANAARTTWNKLIKQFPGSDAAGKAKQQLAALKEG
jgi:TolA-binding protein